MALVGTGVAIFQDDLLEMTLLFLFSIECVLWLHVAKEYQGGETKLDDRLKGYAGLKAGSDSGCSCQREQVCKKCRSDRFEVLLGILKKVEQKAAALLTVWAIILAIVVATAGSNPKLVAAVMVASAPPVLALVGVFYQMDNNDLRHNDGPGGHDFTRSLYESLEKNALKKERDFRFAFEVTRGLTFLTLVKAFSFVLMAE